MEKCIPHSRPDLGRGERTAVSKVLSSGQLACGQETALLEQELSACAGQRYGVSVSSGTAALYAALTALWAGKGTSVVIPSYCCTALLNAVVMTGATPVCADVEYATANLTPDTVKRVLRKDTVAVIVPHLFGLMAPVRDIEKLGVPVVEDCAQCVGAKVDRKKAGSLTTVSVFSLYATKVLCAGEGGLVATSDKRIQNSVLELRDYDNRDTWSPGFNFKLTDLQAAIARVQLGRLTDFLAGRRVLATRYNRAFDGTKTLVGLPGTTTTTDHIFFRYVITVNRGARRIRREMKQHRIYCELPVYKPLHRYLNQNPDAFPDTEKLYRDAVSLPCYPSLTNKEQDRVIDTARSVIQTRRSVFTAASKG